MNIPILKFELERVKESVAAMLTDRNGEINNMIIKSLDAQLTEEWVAKEINDAVQECLKRAIKDMGNNYYLRSAIENAVIEAVSKGISSKKVKTMAQHKWHKEIKAWADGAEIEMWYPQYDGWGDCINPMFDINHKYCIKPEQEEIDKDKEWTRRFAEKALAIPEISDAVDRLFEAFAVKEPQYLYVYNDKGQPYIIFNKSNARNYVGKIKLEVDDDNN